MPEVQKPVLEHPPSKTEEEIAVADVPVNLQDDGTLMGAVWQYVGSLGADGNVTIFSREGPYYTPRRSRISPENTATPGFQPTSDSLHIGQV